MIKLKLVQKKSASASWLTAEQQKALFMDNKSFIMRIDPGVNIYKYHGGEQIEAAPQTTTIDLAKLKVIQPIKPGQQWVHGPDFRELCQTMAEKDGLNFVDAYFLATWMEQQKELSAPILDLLKSGQILYCLGTTLVIKTQEQKRVVVEAERPASSGTDWTSIIKKGGKIHLPPKPVAGKPREETRTIQVQKEFWLNIYWLINHWVMGRNFLEAAFDENAYVLCLQPENKI